MPIRNKTRLFIKNKNLKNITIPILFIFTFLLVFFNKTDYLLIEKVKTNSIDFVVPVTKIVSSLKRFTHIDFDLENEGTKIIYQNN